MNGNEMSPADIAAVTGRNNSGDGMFGGNGAWWIIILFLFVFCGWGNGAWGGNRGGGQGTAMDGYVLTSDFANIERKIDVVNNGLCDGFYAQAQLINGVQMQMANGFGQAELSRSNQQAALMQMLYNMSMDSQKCCCETQRQMERGFADTNYNLATQGCETRNAIQNGTRDIIDAINCGIRGIDQRLTAQEIATKDAKIAEQNQQLFAAQLAASQAAQNQYLVQAIRPCPIPAYTVQNPFCCGQQLC